MAKSLKKLVALACTTVVMAGLLAGCGSNNSSNSNNSGNTASNATNNTSNNTQVEETSDKKVEITFWEQDDAAAQEVLDDIIAKFQDENPNITVSRSHYETEELRTNYTQAAISGTGPDIVLGPNDNIGVFVTADLIQPADEFMGNDFMKTLDPNSLGAAQYQGKQYMIPDRNGNELLLIYNKAMISETPKTWEALEEAGMALKKEGKVDYALSFNEVEPFFTVPFLKAFGGEVFEDLSAENPKPSLNTEAMKQWSEFLVRMHSNGVIPQEADYDVAFNLFKEGKVPFTINGPWALNDIKDAGIDFGMDAIPSINGKDAAAYSAVKGYTISKGIADDKKDAVKKFLAFLNNKENQLKMVDVHKQLPTNIEAMNDPKITEDPMIAGQKSALEKALPMPIVVQMRAVWDAMKPVQQELFAGTMKPEDAPAIMQEKAEEGIKALGF